MGVFGIVTGAPIQEPLLHFITLWAEHLHWWIRFQYFRLSPGVFCLLLTLQRWINHSLWLLIFTRNPYISWIKKKKKSQRLGFNKGDLSSLRFSLWMWLSWFCKLLFKSPAAPWTYTRRMSRRQEEKLKCFTEAALYFTSSRYIMFWKNE